MRSVSIKLGFLLLVITLGSLLGTAIADRPRSKNRQKPAGQQARIHWTASAKTQEHIAEIRLRHQRDAMMYRGTSLGPHKDTQGDVLKLHEAVIAEFARIDPVPPHRQGHFDWLRTTYDPNFVITGWHGTVLDVTPDAGGLIVTAAIGPYIYVPTRGDVPFVKACLMETYRYDPTTKTLTCLGVKEHTHTWSGVLVD